MWATGSAVAIGSTASGQAIFSSLADVVGSIRAVVVGATAAAQPREEAVAVEGNRSQREGFSSDRELSFSRKFLNRGIEVKRLALQGFRTFCSEKWGESRRDFVKQGRDGMTIDDGV